MLIGDNCFYAVFIRQSSGRKNFFHPQLRSPTFICIYIYILNYFMHR